MKFLRSFNLRRHVMNKHAFKQDGIPNKKWEELGIRYTNHYPFNLLHNNNN